jgi:hypothetical protein
MDPTLVDRRPKSISLKRPSLALRLPSNADLSHSTASPLIGGQVSQSAQFAPYNPYYRILNATTSEVDYAVGTIANTYMGDIYQQVSTSAELQPIF